MSQVLENIKTRRSVRAYQDRQIPREILDQILTAGLYAPSAMNAQNRQFTVVQGAEKLEKLRKAVAGAIGKPDYHRFYNAPTLLLLSAPCDFGNAMADCSVALENIFLAAHDLGVSSVWINQLRDVCGEPEVRAVLDAFGVPSDHWVCGAAALGYAVCEAPSDRENTAKVVFA